MQRRAAEESLTDHGKDNSNGRAHVGDAIRHKPGILGFLRQIGFMGATPGRMCDRQGLSLTVGLKGARRRPLEDADLRAQAERFCALARRRGGPPGSHQQPDPAVIGRGQGSLQAARRDRRALLCAQPRSRRHAPDMAARARERAQAIPAPCRRPQSESPDAQTDRRRHPAGGRRADMAVFACLLRQLEPFWSLRWSSSSRRMAKPPSSRYVSPSSETRSIAPFSTGC